MALTRHPGRGKPCPYNSPHQHTVTPLLTFEKAESPEKFWPKYGRAQYDEYKSKIKVNDDVKKAAAQIIGDATTPEQKLERLYDFCCLKIKNSNDDASGLTAADRARLKANGTPAAPFHR